MNLLNKVISNSLTGVLRLDILVLRKISSELMFLSLTETKNRLKSKYKQRAKIQSIFSKLYSQNVLTKEISILKNQNGSKNLILSYRPKKSKVYSFKKMFQIDLDQSRY